MDLRNDPTAVWLFLLALFLVFAWFGFVLCQSAKQPEYKPRPRRSGSFPSPRKNSNNGYYDPHDEVPPPFFSGSGFDA